MSLKDCPIPGRRGFQHPSGSGSLGVMILGEAMGEDELKENRGFVEYGQAGAILERAIRRRGLSREQFVLWNVVPTNPPKNYLEGAPYEHAAVEWGRPYLEQVIADYKPRCILALGNVATRATTGLTGRKLGVSSLTGFVLPGLYNIPVVPCFHPAYLRRGKMSHLGVLMMSIMKAIAVAAYRREPVLPPVDSPPEGYQLYPTEANALEFERAAADARYIAYDIETPYSTDENEAEEAEGEQVIKSIQFSLAPRTGIFLPWREPFREIANRVLLLSTPKVGWNNWRFDDPVLKSTNASIAGENHDLMWAWHHLQPDLPRGLQFAAAQQGWPWPWKHLDALKPQFYGIVDVDVLQWMVANA